MNNKYKFKSIFLCLTAISGILILLDLYLLPRLQINHFYRNPSEKIVGIANISVIKKEDFSYKIIEQKTGLLKQTFKISYITSDRYLGETKAVIGDIITLKQKWPFVWEVSNYVSGYIGVSDNNLNKAQEEIEKQLKEDNLLSKSTEGIRDIEVTNQVLSPNGKYVAQFDNQNENANLLLNGKKVDDNVYHFEWSSDSAFIYYVKTVGNNSKIIKREITTGNSIILLSKDSPSVGFVLLDGILVYTTTFDGGTVRLDGTNLKTLFSFETPVLNSDDLYVPNIIPNEDKSGVTIEIYDKSYLDNQRIRYLVINSYGEIISDQIL